MPTSSLEPTFSPTRPPKPGVRKSVEQPAKVNEYNVDDTITLLKAARRHDVERVIVASSSSVYGKPEYLPYEEDHPTTP
jgi:UDP-glucose 4-epimerase